MFHLTIYIALLKKSVKLLNRNLSHPCHSRESGNPVSKRIFTISGFPIKSGMTFQSGGSKPKVRGVRGYFESVNQRNLPYHVIARSLPASRQAGSSQL